MSPRGFPNKPREERVYRDYVLAVRLNREQGLGCAKIAHAFKETLGRGASEGTMDVWVNGRFFPPVPGQPKPVARTSEERRKAADKHTEMILSTGLVDKNALEKDYARIAAITAPIDKAKLHALAVFARLHERNRIGPRTLTRQSKQLGVKFTLSEVNRWFVNGAVSEDVGMKPERRVLSPERLSHDYMLTRTLLGLPALHIARHLGHPARVITGWKKGTRPKEFSRGLVDMARVQRDAEIIKRSPVPVQHPKIRDWISRWTEAGHIDPDAVEADADKLFKQLQPPKQEVHALVLAYMLRERGWNYADIARGLHNAGLGPRMASLRMKAKLLGGTLPHGAEYLVPDIENKDARAEIAALKAAGLNSEQAAAKTGASVTTAEKVTAGTEPAKDTNPEKIHKRLVRFVAELNKKGLIDADAVRRDLAELGSFNQGMPLPKSVVEKATRIELDLLKSLPPEFWKDERTGLILSMADGPGEKSLFHRGRLRRAMEIKIEGTVSEALLAHARERGWLTRKK